MSELEKQELEMIEVRLDEEDTEIYAPYEKFQREQLKFRALQVKQLREISKQLDDLLEKVSQNGRKPPIEPPKRQSPITHTSNSLRGGN